MNGQVFKIEGEGEWMLAMLKRIDRSGTRWLACLQMKHAMVANKKRFQAGVHSKTRMAFCIEVHFERRGSEVHDG